MAQRALVGATAERSRNLDRTVMRRAFALVSLSHPHLSFGDWSRYLSRAARLDPRRAGLVSIEDPRGYARALFRYIVDRDRPFASTDMSLPMPCVCATLSLQTYQDSSC